MTSRALKATSPASAAEVIARLADEAAFPAHAGDVLSVTHVGDGLREWVLAFRGGTATWVQRSIRTDGDAHQPHRIDFEQVDGEFQDLRGSWAVAGLPGGGCEIAFEIAFSTSVPHLAGAIDSAVGRVLIRTAQQIMAAVGGPIRITAGGRYLWSPPLKTATKAAA